MPEILELSETLENQKINAALLFGQYPYADEHPRLSIPSASDKDLIEYMMVMDLHRKSEDFRRKLQAMETLQDNWDTYGAEAPNPQTISDAISLLVQMEHMRFLPSEVLASSEGGIALSFKSASRYADIELLNSGEVLAVVAEGSQQQPVAWEVKKTARDFEEAIYRIYDFFSA